MTVSRRRFLKDAAVSSAALVFGGTTSGILAECYSKNLNSGVRKENNPNIIIILVDDMG